MRKQGFQGRRTRQPATLASPLGSYQLTTCGSLGRQLFEQLFFAINERIYVIGGQLEAVAMSNRVSRTSLDAVPAENAARVIDVVDARVTFAGRNAIRVLIFRSLNVNAIRRAGRRTQKTSNALL